jgi:hypothetical protein
MKKKRTQTTSTQKNKPIFEKTEEPPSNNESWDYQRHLDNKSEYGFDDDDWSPIDE